MNEKPDLVSNQEAPKRFKIQEDSFARERVAALKETVKELKREHPEILSLEVFGSLVKGKSKVESDLDGQLFIDVDKVAAKEQAEGKTGDDVIDMCIKKEPHEDLGIDNIIFRPYLRKDLYDYYNQLIQRKILAKLPELDAGQVEHLRSLPLSRSLFVQLLDKVIGSRKNFIELDKAVEKITGGERLTKDRYLEVVEQIKEKPRERISIPINIWSLFHLDIGGGIKEYRELVIDKLLAAGPAGERVWHEIMSLVEAWEQKVKYGDLPTKFHYPRTLQEAKSFYGNR